MRVVRLWMLAWLGCVTACATAGIGTTTGDAGIDASTGNDGGPGPDAGDDAPHPPPGPASITITSPADGAALTFDGEPLLPVAFTVTGFELGDALSCGDTPNCGDVWINIDGLDCDEPTGGAPARNAEGTASPVVARLEFCYRGTEGAHTIVASLHDKNGDPYKDSTGKAVVSATVHITGTAIGDDGGTD